MCVGSFHAGRSGGLASAVQVSTVPAIVGVINERLYHYKGTVSINSLIEFARGLFPTNFITKVCVVVFIYYMYVLKQH